MKKQRKTPFIRMTACLLAILFLVPVTAGAAVPEAVIPRASDYITAYNAYICPMGDGELDIWFRLVATDDWADVGALTIELYEATEITKWTLVETYSHRNHSNMMVEDYYFCMSHVDYDGTPGKYYKAYVTLWAGDENGGDTRYLWTTAKLAT